MGVVKARTVLRRAWVVAFAALFIAVVAIRIGSAASLALDADDLLGQISPDTPALTVDDNFRGNGNLNNRTPPTAPPGKSWNVNTGRFRTRNGVAESRRNPLSRATINTGLSDEFTVHTQIVQLGDAEYVGLVFLAQGGTFMYAVYNGVTDKAEVYTSASGTPIASSGSLGGPTAFSFSVNVDQPSITVNLGGVAVISYTMSAAQVATYGSHLRSGLIAETKKAMFEYFTVKPT